MIKITFIDGSKPSKETQEWLEEVERILNENIRQATLDLATYGTVLIRDKPMTATEVKMLQKEGRVRLKELAERWCLKCSSTHTKKKR